MVPFVHEVVTLIRTYKDVSLVAKGCAISLFGKNHLRYQLCRLDHSATGAHDT